VPLNCQDGGDGGGSGDGPDVTFCNRSDGINDAAECEACGGKVTSDGESCVIPVEDATVPPIPRKFQPKPPALTAVTQPSAGGPVNLTWNDLSTNETGFKVQRKLASQTVLH
jgi:hypothetical protein